MSREPPKIRKLKARLSDMGEQLAKKDARIADLEAEKRRDDALWESPEGKARHEHPRDDLHQREAVYRLLNSPKLMRARTHLQMKIFGCVLELVTEAVVAGKIPGAPLFR